jgi:hypothetical protein
MPNRSPVAFCCCSASLGDRFTTLCGLLQFEVAQKHGQG